MKCTLSLCMTSFMALALIACSPGSDSTAQPVTVEPDPNFPPPSPSPQFRSNGYLANLGTDSAVFDYMLNQENEKRDYRKALDEYYSQSFYDGTVTTNDSAVPEMEQDDDSDLSETNTYEKGVDEADIVKHIDNHVFLVNNPHAENLTYLEDYDIYVHRGWCDQNPELVEAEFTQSGTLQDQTTYAGIAAALTDYCEGLTVPADISVYHVDPSTAESSKVNDIVFSSDFTVNTLYTHAAQNKDILIAQGVKRGGRNSYDYGHTNDDIYWSEANYWSNVFTHINILDVTNPDNIHEQFNFSIDGTVIDTRKLNDKLYVVSKHLPTLTQAYYDAFSSYRVLKDNGDVSTTKVEEIKQTLYAELLKSTITPSVRLNLSEAMPAYDLDSCLISINHADALWDTGITTVTTIDLNDPSKISYHCHLAPVHGFYASKNAMYFTTTKRNNTHSIIHQLNYTDTGVEYAGSGEFEGVFGWGRIGYKMSEHEGYLRLISERPWHWGCWAVCWNTPDVIFEDEPEEAEGMTSDSEEVSETTPEVKPTPFDHSDYVLMTMKLNLDTKVIETVDTYPRIIDGELNGNRIGKPNERLQGFRFAGEKAYAVTFLWTDPLYAFDLSDPTAIKMTGELEIPGFSDYLHPLSNDLVLGVGTQDGNLKVSLYDMSSEDNISVVQDIIFQYDNSYSPAAFNHYAFSVVEVEEHVYRFALPYYGYYYRSDDAESGLALFEVDTQNQVGLTAFRHIMNEEVSYRRGDIRRDRSILSSDAIFYIHQDALRGYLWEVRK